MRYIICSFSDSTSLSNDLSPTHSCFVRVRHAARNRCCANLTATPLLVSLTNVQNGRAQSLFVYLGFNLMNGRDILLIETRVLVLIVKYVIQFGLSSSG